MAVKKKQKHCSIMYGSILAANCFRTCTEDDILISAVEEEKGQ